MRLDLPLMDRKWNRVDCLKISRNEQAKINKEKVFSLYKSGVKMSQISKQLSMLYTTVWAIVKRRDQ